MHGRYQIPAAWLVVALVVVWAQPLSAQLQTGNLYGTVTDNEGQALPGVTVTLGGGPGGTQIQITNANGQFRFLGLDPGNHQLTSALEGFSTVEYPNVDIRIGRNTTIEVSMSPQVEETITVTTESPLLDERKIQHGTTVTQVELEKIPTARDPWSVLQTVPGVLVDRINVGGNESGQRGQFVGAGSSQGQNTFLIDGVEITDHAAVGATPTYYNFDAFEEMQFQTGGDAQASASGVMINVITKRGTNEWRGSGRFLVTDDAWSAGSSSAGPIDTTDFGTRELNGVNDAGFELGGPIIKDKLWFFGNFARAEIDSEIFGGGEVFHDDTELESYAAKLNAALTDSNRATLFFTRSERTGVGQGAGATRPSETTWNQSGPTDIIKFEDSHVFNSSFFLTGMYGRVDFGSSLVPQGGLSGLVPRLDATGIWRDNYYSETTSRVSEEWKIDGSYFFNTGNTNHDIQFGTRLREFEAEDFWGWGQGQIKVDDAASGFYLFPGETRTAGTLNRTSFYVQDTLRFDQFTVNLGVRYDGDTGKTGPSTITANPFLPGLVPDLTVPGEDLGFEWESITPRVGITYALGEERKTLLRASFARFPQQLSGVPLNLANPVAEHFMTFRGVPGRRGIDKNGNGMLDPGEPGGEIFTFGGVGVGDPAFLTTPTVFDPEFDPVRFSQWCLFLEHELWPGFVIDGSVKYGGATGLAEFPRLVFGQNGAPRPTTFRDFLPGAGVTGTLPDGTPYDVGTFTLDPSLALTGGNLLTNGDREADYQGFGIGFTKRLSNRWMMRGHFTYQDWNWDVPTTFDLGDPNPIDALGRDGEAFAERSLAGDKSDIFLHSTWSFNVNGLYQVAPDRPWGFNVAANVFGREGYPLPYYDQVTEADGVSRNIQVGGLGDVRTDDILTVDLRLDKEFQVNDDFDVTISADAFNLFDEDYALQRRRQLNQPSTDDITEILSPRVWRFGVRLNWN